MEKRIVESASQPCLPTHGGIIKKVATPSAPVLVVTPRPRVLLEIFRALPWKTMTGWTVLSSSTVFIVTALFAAVRPILPLYLLGWPTSELPQFLLPLQIVSLHTAARCGILHGLTGRLTMLLHAWLALRALAAFRRTFDASVACQTALAAAGIHGSSRTRRSGLWAAAKRMLRICLPLPGLIGMGLKVYRDIPYVEASTKLANSRNPARDMANSVSNDSRARHSGESPSVVGTVAVSASGAETATGLTPGVAQPLTERSSPRKRPVPRSVQLLRHAVQFIRGGDAGGGMSSKAWLRLDVYVAGDSEASGDRTNSGKQETPLLPVMFYVHGGGWVVCDKSMSMVPLVRGVAATGRVVVVSANYRLAPEAAFPAQLIDAKRALVWVHHNIRNFGGDPSRVVVCGESAGGHLSAMIALTQQDPRYQPGFEHEPTKVVGCVDLYGYHDFTDSAGYTSQLYPQSVSAMHKFLLRKSGHTGFIESIVMQRTFETHREDYELASPLFILRSLPDRAFVEGSGFPMHVPPFMVLCTGVDCLLPVEGMREFFRELRGRRTASTSPLEAPVCDVCIELKNAQHAVGYIVSPQSAALVDAVTQFVCTVAAGPSPNSAISARL